MRKLILVTATALFAISNNADAQPRKGTWSVGANIMNGGAVGPKAGYFVSDKLMLGAGLNFSFSANHDLSYTAYYAGVHPFARYYFASKGGMQANRFYFFLDASVGYNIGLNYSKTPKLHSNNSNIRGASDRG